MAQIYPVTSMSSVSLPTGVWTQMPNIVCDDVMFAKTPQDISLAMSATPGNAVMDLNLSTATGQVVIPTGGNAANLYLQNMGPGTINVGFMWRLRGMQFTIPGV